MNRQQLLERVIARLERKIEKLEYWNNRYSWSRLWIALSGFFITFILNHFIGGFYPWATGLLSFISFFVIVHYHNKIEDSLNKHRIYLKIKKYHIARMTLDWPNMPAQEEVPIEDHPFQTDLNLTGHQSLYQCLDTTASKGGSERLRAWLLNQDPDLATIQARQKAIQELSPLLGLRDRLNLNGQILDQEIDRRWDGEQIIHWLTMSTAQQSIKPWVIALGSLAVCNIGLGLAYLKGALPAYWGITFTIYCLIYIGLYHFSKVENLGTLIDESDHLRKILHPFRAILLKLEAYPFAKQPTLNALCAPLKEGHHKPSEHLREVALIASATRIKKDSLFHPILNALMPWDLYFTHRLNNCKKAIQAHLPEWLDIWNEFEALNALSHYTWATPQTTFPTCQQTDDTPLFQGTDLGHPLIPQNERVLNSFTFNQQGDVIIITGSNMSGKSTFLRTLGVNLTLAYAGAPVLATSLQTGLFRLFTCIKVSDSVIDGISYFYAEVRRLKALLAELRSDHPLPVFFLIDEIFRGTNNRERFIGSRSYIQALTQHHGLGIVSTHDLELVHLEKEFPNIRNFHFRETIQNNKMAFDYKLHPGPCPTTNALTIMRLEGLPVEDSTQ